uniref:AN1-type domain-containing protein n=1 Tax=viral metagenome TaxID=1070528 RepID=A0A6C0CYA1_9ZZZZ
MILCSICNKKLSNLMSNIYTCKCRNIYCPKHLLAHDCTFDYKAEFKRYNNLESISNEKVTKI